MNSLQQPTQQYCVQSTQNKFLGKKIENSLTFNMASQIKVPQNDANEIQSCIAQVHSNKAQATPHNYAIPQKKNPSKIIQNQPVQINQSADKQKFKNKAGIKQQENGTNLQQISQQNLKNLIQEQQRSKREEIQLDGYSKHSIPINFSERRQSKKLEQIQSDHAFAKKDISIIQQATNISNLSSDCEEFVDIMMPKKNLKNITSHQQQFQSQQQISQIKKEQKKQQDVDDMIRKSNLKYKTDKELQEINRQQKQTDMQKLKEKLKKQEEEIRKRNQQKTQQFKEKKKRKEKEIQKIKQEQLQQQNDQQKRRKSFSKINQSQQFQNNDHRQNTSQQNTSRDNIVNQKNEINKEQFDLATKNRVKELMKKQKEEKERLEEEKEKKKLKLEILRQEQLIQLQKAKVKTIEQEEDERRQQIVKRTGGSSIAVPQFVDQRDTRQSLHQKTQQDHYQYQQGQQQYIFKDQQYNESNQDFEDNDLSFQKRQEQQNMSYQEKSYKQKKSIINKPTNNVRPQSNFGIKKNKVQENGTESFLQENIGAFIKQLYPGCSLEELIQLEEEYKREYAKEQKKQNKLNNFKNKQQSKSNIKKPNQLKKNNQNDFEKLKKKQQYETKEELHKLLELKKFDDFDINTVKNPIEMIENLKNLASQIQEDIDQNDRRYGVGKYKRQKNSHQTSQMSSYQQPQNRIENMKQENSLIQKENYLKQLYENAQNTFSPQEMQEFEVYLQNHLVNGEIILSDDERENYSDEQSNDEGESEYEEENEDEDYNEGEQDEDFSYQNQNNGIQQKNQFKNQIFKQIQQQKSNITQQLPLNKKQQQYPLQNKQLKKQFNHSKSVQNMSNQDSATKRGRSQDPKTPKSCLVKEQKQKRSKTVTFDQSYAQSEQKSRLQLSPSIRQQQEKYDFNELDDFNERDAEGTSLMSQQHQLNQQRIQQNQFNQNQYKMNDQNIKQINQAMKQQEDQRNMFEKKVQDMKDLIRQYSGDKIKSIDISNPISSLESSVGSNLRLSHLKTQNSTNAQTLNDVSKQFPVNQQQGIVINQRKKLEIINENNKQILQVQQNQKQIEQQSISINNNLQTQNQQKLVPNQQQKAQNLNQKPQIPQMKNNQKINPSQENINTLNTPNTQQMKSKQNNQKQIKDSYSTPVTIAQSSPQVLSNIPVEFENDFLTFNEQFDIDQFKSQLSQDELRQLIHVNNLDLKSFFTNEKLNSVQKIQGQQLKQQQYDDVDEGLFAEDSPRQNKMHNNDELSQSEKAFNYYEKNKDLLQSNDKNDKKQFNNYMIQEQFQNNDIPIIENEYLSSYSEFNKDFLDDDKLFALSATDLMKLTQTNTKLQK